MKNFLTSMLGALVALGLFAFFALLLFIGVVGAIISVGAKKGSSGEKFDSGSYLVFDLSTNIVDAPPVLDFGALAGDREENLQLRAVTRALRIAARDDRIAGIFLKGSFKPAGLGSGYGALWEVRNALLDFRRSGKPVKAYLELADNRDYFVASAASEITLDPYGLIFAPGLAAEPMFYAGGLQKFGVGVQVTRVGKYKSFVEPFTRKEMSPENREETQRLLDDLWGSLLAAVGRSRKLTPGAIQATVDREGLVRAEVAKSARLVDRVAYLDQVIDELKAGTDRQGTKESFKQVSLPNYIRSLKDPADRVSGDALAIVYAEGDIVDGEGALAEVGGTAFARELRKLREDDSIKAIVLRVNSPGGSTTASEAIGREIRLARRVKPVIVSMGSYAASGGYWISAYGDRIFADPTTITGSIGVFGIQFDVQKLFNNYLGITFDGVKTGKFADSLTVSRPKTDDELAVFQHLVDWIYGDFVGKVAEGRKMTRAQVEQIAQGRVWSGAEARRIGLVDDIGDLPAAIRYAAEKAGLSNGFRIVEYPGKKGLADQIKTFLGKRVDDAVRSRETAVAAQVERHLDEELAVFRSFNDPRNVYARLPLDLSIR